LLARLLVIVASLGDFAGWLVSRNPTSRRRDWGLGAEERELGTRRSQALNLIIARFRWANRLAAGLLAFVFGHDLFRFWLTMCENYLYIGKLHCWSEEHAYNMGQSREKEIHTSRSIIL